VRILAPIYIYHSMDVERVGLRPPHRRIYMRIARLHPLFEQDGDIGAESVSVETTSQDVSVENASAQETASETPETKESESSFAKRLREHSEKEVKNAREAWEKESGDKFKDYDTHKELSDYFQKINGLDAMTLKERIEMEALQERAQANDNISPEMQKRLEALESEAAEGNKLKQQQQEDQRVTTYFSTLTEFVKDKGVDPKDLNQFMIDNELQYNPANMEKSFDIALKAFKADDAVSKLATAKEDAVKEYLASKKGPRVEGAPGSASVQAVDTRKMSTEQLNRHVLERFKAMSTPQ
jgi:hypothetical protein